MGGNLFHAQLYKNFLNKIFMFCSTVRHHSQFGKRQMDCYSVEHDSFYTNYARLQCSTVTSTAEGQKIWGGWGIEFKLKLLYLVWEIKIVLNYFHCGIDRSSFNRFFRRKRGVASNPLFIIPDFFAFFQWTLLWLP